IFTHAALYIPRDIVQQLSALAQLTAVFMLPSGGQLDLEYLDLVDAHWVVDHGVLSQGQERAEAALSILDEKGTSSSGPASERAIPPSSRRPARSAP
ncbi:MAG: hypothetical protein AAGA56_30335, partial [Myxococcota bacterium]